MDLYQSLISQLDHVQQQLHYVFRKKEPLVLAFVHRSFYNEHRHLVQEHNERLEFLGDSVLNILMSEYLYSTFPEKSEGQLSQMRAYLVDASMCAALLRRLNLADLILLGKGERMSEGKKKESIQADLFEAILGALFLDGGLEVARQFFWHHFQSAIEAKVQLPVRNWKAELQDYFQKKGQKAPLYHVLSSHGPDHFKEFEVGVYVEDKQVGKGMGHSKKEAEQNAARCALHQIEKKDN